jgi:hypothetical protein
MPKIVDDIFYVLPSSSSDDSNNKFNNNIDNTSRSGSFASFIILSRLEITGHIIPVRDYITNRYFKRYSDRF